MMEIFKTEYWSTSDTLLLPLTGLGKTDKFELKSYLFWRDYSIFDYNLIISVYRDDYSQIEAFCQNYIFPILDKKIYLLESYDIGERTIFVLDMSEWAMDIEMFLVGKYSKFSTEAKQLIKDYHGEKVVYTNNIPYFIYAMLYPTDTIKILDNKSAIQYINDNYGIDLTKLGEIGNKYDKIAETLYTEVDELCHIDI